MTLKQIGVAAAVAAVLVTAWLGIWGMVDRRFAEMRAEMQAGFDAIREDMRDANARLDAVADAVNVLVGRQQERDRAPADD